MSGDLYGDAELYDLLHEGYRDDFPFYRRLADDHGGPVLEIGAGSGRVTLELARCGHEVVAVEPAVAMRERGDARLSAAGLDDRVTWVAADVRELALGTRFPLAIAPFHALMHLERLEDQDAALQAIRSHLRPTGAFATDVYVPRIGPDGAVRGERTRVGDLWTFQTHDPVGQIVVTEHRLDAMDAEGNVHRRAATLRQRYFQRFELERALRSAGFAEVRVHGGFDRGPVTAAATSWAFVARMGSVT